MGASRVLVAAAVVALLGAAPTARAALAWTPCDDAPVRAFECATAPVPLDRADPAAGTVRLFARRLRAPVNPTATAVVALAGGPGQAATPFAADLAIVLAPALRDRDLLVFDQRGTGRSGRLACRALAGGVPTQAAVGRCAAELGPRRALYRTRDSVDDLEALRAQAGYARLTLVGVSYGTKVALAYAARHPDRVERLVLDSVVPPDGPDPLQRSSFRAVPRILRALCAGGGCRGASPDPVADIRRLIGRDRRIRGAYVDGAGRRRRLALDADAIYAILRSGDLNPAWRALLPGAVRAAVRRDPDPLVRLAAATGAGAPAPAGWPGADVAASDAVFVATICEETVFPWARDAGRAQRAEQAAGALLREPAATFRPFRRETAAAAGLLPLCLAWPNAAPPPEPPGALPAVPTLILAGTADVRTPVEDARAVAAQIPGARLVTVPYAGHSVLGTDTSGCAQAAITGFFADGVVPRCPRSAPVLPVLARPPRSVAELRGTAGIGGRTGRTLTAVIMTRDDTLVRALGARLDGVRVRFGGLRAGTVVETAAGLRLRGVEHVRGVRVSGTFPNEGTARLTVGGSRAAHGTLALAADGRITGRLGGRRIRLRARALHERRAAPLRTAGAPAGRP
jgi:pimeloyl-ACP methyl ester carboxylesterase